MIRAVGLHAVWGVVPRSPYDSGMELQFTAVFRPVPEGYIAFVEELPGANTQGATLEEARRNLREAVGLVLDANRQLTAEATAGADVIREALKITAWSVATWFGI
jgi:predicted RNase H-like HicB family nuclease